MALTVRHEFNKRRGKILSKRFHKGGYEHFYLHIYVDGEDAELDSLERVEYQLHSTFDRPLRVARDRSRNFQLNIWTWGEFDIYVTFHFLDGRVEERVHSLKYSDQLPPGDNAYLDTTDSKIKE